MSENSKKWMEKYYPIAASELANASPKECVEHSLLKWQGLVNAEEYGLLHDRRQLIAPDNDTLILDIDVTTCALCHKYYGDDCLNCPLAKLLDSACDQGENLYQRSLGNPQLMVDALTTVLNNLENSD